MRYNLIITFSMLFSLAIFSQTYKEVQEKLGGAGSGGGTCLDKVTSIPTNGGFNKEKKEAYIYFKEGITESDAIKKILIQAKASNLAPSVVLGVASLIPWGACKNDVSTHGDFNKLKSCNDKLSKQRADNVGKYAQEMFGGIAQIHTKNITGEVKFSENCKTYDDKNKEAYHKYQYVHIKFGTPKCTSGKIYTSAGSLAMKGGKCSGVCTDNNSSMLGDKKTQCSRYVRFAKDTSITLDALSLPDRFKMISVKDCKPANVVFDTGYISKAQPYFLNPNPAAHGAKIKMEVKELSSSSLFYEYQCTNIPTDNTGSLPSGTACKKYGDGFYCYEVAGGKKLEARKCNKVGHVKLFYKLNLSTSIKLDYIKKEVPDFPSMTMTLINVSSGAKINKNSPEAKQLDEYIQSNNKRKFLKAKHAVIRIYKNSGYDDIKLTMKDGLGGSSKLSLKGMEGAYKKVLASSVDPKSVKMGPVMKSVPKGDYCLQVEAPVDNTAWTAK